MATSDHDLIRNAIAHFSFALDQGNYDLLSRAFTDDAVVHYPEPIGTLSGLKTLTEATRGFLNGLKTHHALSTQAIDLTSDTTASATTYIMAYHFGVGENEGKSVTGWGQFVDKLVKGTFDGEVGWRTVERKVDFHVPHAGDKGLFNWEVFGDAKSF